MARGGGRRTNYVRDASGRFASTPGGPGKGLGASRKKAAPAARKSNPPAQLKGGTLAARSSLKASRAKLAAMAKPSGAQKGAVTRGNKALKAAMKTSQKSMAPMKGVVGKPKGLKPGDLAKRQESNNQVPGRTIPAQAKTAPKRKRMAAVSGTIGKPKGLKPGDLAKRREVKAQTAAAKAQPVKRNRFLDPIARQILIATGQIPRKKAKR